MASKKNCFDLLIPNVNSQALHNVIYPGYKEGKKIVVVTGLESLVPAIAAVCNKSGIR